MPLPPDPLSLFLSSARENENRPAVIDGGKSWSYGELLARVMQLAHAISKTGAEHPRVAINLTQSVDAYAAMFATLVAGGFYCPLNLTHPVGRRSKVLSLFEPHVVVTGSLRQIEGLSIAKDAVIIVCEEPLATQAMTAPAKPDHLAYVMFTSGSTGEPKGVMVGREGLGHYTLWAQQMMKLTPEDRWSQHPNIAFDLSVLDIYGALCSGATLVPISNTKSRLAPALVVRDHKLTIWNSVPSVVDLITRAGHLTREMLAPLRLMTFCGEPLLRGHLEAIFTARPDLLVHNTYGPTEATVSCTLARLDRNNYRDRCRTSVTLGAAIDGMRLDLNGSNNIDEGEIVISGPQVAYGYWRRPDLTAAAFEFSSETPPIHRSYRTGDWGQRDGEDFYFVARNDRQVKRLGYRIELGDIDAAARTASNRPACTVYVDHRLCTFLEGVDGIPVHEVMRNLGEKLPPYMLPDEIRYIGQFPRNANDKIDVSALDRLALNEHGKGD